MSSEKNIIWADNGYTNFGFKLPYVKYELYSDKIRVTTGFFTQKTQEVPLYRIASKETLTNPLGRLFHCGQVHLIVGNRKVPDLYLSVKNPDNVLIMIDRAKAMEQEEYNRKAKERRRQRYENDRKRV